MASNYNGPLLVALSSDETH